VKDTATASHEACVFALNATVGRKLMYFCVKSAQHPWSQICSKLYVELSRRDL
jgi:hypothetical protein